MPEMPEMQGLAERLSVAVAGARFERIQPIGFAGLKTASPPAETLVGAAVTAVGRRGKYVVFEVDRPLRVALHLSQAGRVDLEEPPKQTRPKGGVVRFLFDNGTAVLVREHGTERKAGWWVLAAGDEGPLERLGPEPGTTAFRDLILTSADNRHLHTLLRDQRFVAGLGRGHTDDALNRARLSPFASLKALPPADRERLLDAIDSVLAEALERERERTGGLSEPKLGTRFLVHNRAGQPCPNCGAALLRVSYESHEVVYCKECQTRGKALADRRLSRLLK
jgi:formamidopyrimidine-DNA glycosylase